MVVGKGVALHAGQPRYRYRHLICFPVKPCQLSSCCVKENTSLKVPLAANLVFDGHRCRPSWGCYIGPGAQRIAVVGVCTCRWLFEILHPSIVLALPSRFCAGDVCRARPVHFYRSYWGLSVLLAKWINRSNFAHYRKKKIQWPSKQVRNSTPRRTNSAKSKASGRGKVVVATDGCSRFFIEGKLECLDVDALATVLAHLRADLLYPEP